MSQTSKALKKIASGDEYKTLVSAIETADYDAILSSYLRISELLGEAEKEIQERLQSLPQRSKDEAYQRFRSAFASRAMATLPQWYHLNSEMERRKIAQGEVVGTGSKGDPVARTREGRMVVITGAALEQGNKVRFRLVAEGERMSFGRLFELTPDSFYFILSEDTREKIRSSLISVRQCLNDHALEADESGWSQTEELLRKLEDIRDLASRLRTEERDGVIVRAVAYRRQLLERFCLRRAFQLLREEEKKKVAASCQGDGGQLAGALSAPGLFDYQAHEDIKADLFSGDDIKGYSDVLEAMEKNLDSMDSALKLLDFKSRIKEALPAAKGYFQNMDRLFSRLSERARMVVAAMAEDKICEMEQMRSAIKHAFSDTALYTEVRKAFRSPEEFFALREALAELLRRLGHTEYAAAEAALKPYLRQAVTAAFEGRR